MVPYYLHITLLLSAVLHSGCLADPVNPDFRLVNISDNGLLPHAVHHNKSSPKLKNALRFGSESSNVDDGEDYYYADDSAYYDGSESKVRNFTLEDSIQSFGEGANRADVVMESAYDDSDNFTESEYDDSDYELKTIIPTAPRIFTQSTTKLVSTTAAATATTTTTTTTTELPTTVRQVLAPNKSESAIVETPLPRGPKETRVFYVVRLNITSLLYDPSLEDSTSHMYKQVALKVQQAFYQEVLSKIGGTHTIVFVKFGKPVVLVTIYVTTEMAKATFETVVREILLRHLKMGVLGEFMLGQEGFEFKETNALDAALTSPASAVERNDLLSEPSKKLYGEDEDAFDGDDEDAGADDDDIDAGRSDVKPQGGNAEAALKGNVVNANVDFDGDDDTRCLSEEISCNGRCANRCDGLSECDDGRDEENCPAICSSDEKACADGRQCVRADQWCDGRVDCDDRSDEKNCVVRVDPDDFLARSGTKLRLTCHIGEETSDSVTTEWFRLGQKPLPLGTKINGATLEFTLNSEDDAGPYLCRVNGAQGIAVIHYEKIEPIILTKEEVSQTPQRVRIEPDTLYANAGTQVELTCILEGSYNARNYRVTWSRVDSDGRPRSLPKDAHQDNNKLIFTPVSTNDGGKYHCRIEGVEGMARITISKHVPSQPVFCRDDERRCPDGRCFPNSKVCDGHCDCTGCDDETGCDTASRRGGECHPNEWRCKINKNKCIVVYWRCDGQDDCSGDGIHDNSDEEGCEHWGRHSDQGSCSNFTMWQCADHRQCVQRSWLCADDREHVQCADRSDFDCTSPRVVEPPVKENYVPQGGTLRCRCVTAGKPFPMVVWRYNWQHLPSDPRIEVKDCYNGTSELTIRQVSTELEGAYTCEAVNLKDRVLAVPDCQLIVQVPRYDCPAGTYNALARSAKDCQKCWCSGVSTRCSSSDLYLGVVRVDSQPPDVVDEANTETDKPRWRNEQGMWVLDDYESEFSAYFDQNGRKDLYVRINASSVPNWLYSYGGYLNYSFSFTVHRPPFNHLAKADILLVRKQDPERQRVYYNYLLASISPVRPVISQDGKRYDLSVRLVEGEFEQSAWRKIKKPEVKAHGSSDVSTPPNLVTRDEFLHALANLEAILIRISYAEDRGQRSTKFGNVRVTMANPTGTEKAASVEKCECPEGYIGNSCEKCDRPRYYRNRHGQCVRCLCYNHADTCDEMGVCINCDHNTEGDHCECCKPGFSGDPRRGTPEDCLSMREPCHPEGSLTKFPDPVTDRCQCKPGVTGRLCDQCMTGFFHLHSAGCLRCFCSGHNVSCTSSTWRRKTIVAVFDQSSGHAGGINLAEMTGLTVPGSDQTPFPEDRPALNLTSKIKHHHRKNGIYFDQFTEEENGKILWWRLPSSFEGYKVTSYGGKLKFTISYHPAQGTSAISTVASGNVAATKLVRIYGNNFELLSKLDAPMISEFKPPDYKLTFDILINEANWLYVSGDSFQEKSREELLMALSDISHIYVLATFGTLSMKTELLDVSITIADRNGNGIPSPEVEICECLSAVHTEGTSCELCKPGYYHSIEGLYLGTCKKCQCHNHAKLCEDRTGYCINCEHFTEGEQCENCIAGYTGNARKGTEYDCTQIKKPKPVVKIHQGKEIYVRKGDRLILTCTLSGADLEGGLFTWQRNPPGGAGLESKIRDIGGRTLELRLEQVDWGDAGEYNCRYDHPDGSTVDYIRVGVIGVEVQPATASIKEGDQHLFECRVLGFTLGRNDRLEWRKDGSPLPNGCRSHDLGRKLEIVSVKLEHEGRYECSIRVHGLDLTAFGQLAMVPDVVHPFVRFDTTIYYAYKGENVKIRCTMLQGKPIVMFHIRRLGEQNQTLPFQRDQRVDHEGEKSLTLNIEGFTEEHAGPYSCEAYGSEGRSEAIVVVRYVELEILPGNKQNIREGQEIEFACQIKGEEMLDDIDIIWVDANDVDRVISNSNTFVLKATKQSPHRISRLCIAKRRTDGRRISSSPLDVSIYHPRPHSLRVYIELVSPRGPRRLAENESIKVKVGERLELWCVAEGFPKPGAQFEAEPHRPLSVTQQNNEAPLFFSPLEKPEEHRTVAKLVINTITPVDRGAFVCSGRNGRGRQERTANIRVNVEVIADPVKLALVVEPEPLRVGNRVTIKCSVSSGPRDKILEIDSPSRRGGDVEVFQSDGETRLVIPKLASNHAGLYSCYPRGDSSVRVSKSVVVVTIFGPEDIAAGSSGQLTCRADGLPDNLVIGWIREVGRPLADKHSVDEQTGVLMLNRFDRKDAGSYVCQIRNINDGKIVAEASISVMIKMIQFQIDIRRPERIYLGEEISLHCTTSHGVVLTHVEWSTPRGSISTRNHQVSNARCGDALCQQLIIQRWDDTDNGGYQCSVCDENGNSGVARVDLTHRGIRNFAVKIVAEGEPFEDRHFTLTCGGDGRRIQINFQREDGRSWEGISAENNQLIFKALLGTHSGVYVCNGDDGYGNRAVDRYTLRVVERPRFSSDPEAEINLFVGERLHIDCSARGHGRLVYVINKDDRAIARDQQMFEVDQVRKSDASRYRCLVSNDAGSVERDFVVHVHEPQVSISVKPSRPIAGQPCEMRCSVGALPRGTDVADYRWYRGDRLVHQGESVYILEAPAVADSGQYACEVTIRGLVFINRITVTITGIPPTITISPSDSVITIVYGETLVLNCSATGQPQPAVMWSAPPAVERQLQQRDGVLRVRISSVEFGGYYTCSAENSVGKASSKIRVMILGGPPRFERTEEVHTALVGSSVRIDCGSYLSNSDPDIIYSWSLKGGRPITTSRASVQGNILEIYESRIADESEYECVASNSHGSATLLLRLYIERRLPSFRQATSFMKVKDGITKPTEYLSVEMTFRPENPNGRVLYKGGQDTEADFFCVALRNSQLYLEASAGLEPINGVISSTLAMNKWHTVRISRKQSEITVVVDGSSKILTLAQPNEPIDFRANFLYLGALPYGFSPRATSQVQTSESFIGAISRLKVQDRVIDFSPTSEHYDAVDASFESFQTCQVDAVECQHNGICQSFDNERGFRCVCRPGSFGEFCERQTPDKCFKSLCGEGICLQKQPAGYQCLCPAGFQGRHCEIRDVVVTVPEFNLTSFVRTTLKDFQPSDLRIGLSFRPQAVSANGHILFFAQSSASSDFFLLALTNSGRVRFTFSVLGSKPSTIESDSAVQFGDWNSAIAECDQNGGQLIVNGGSKKVLSAPVSGRMRTFSIGIDKTVYVGGIDPTIETLTSHPALSGLIGFLGCMKWLYHGPSNVPLLQPEGDASGRHQVAAYHVVQCHQPSTGCDARPCQNNGLCHDKPGKLHYCSCQTGFHGEDCQNVVDVCRQLELSSTPPCSPPNGECVAGEKVYKCSCKLPYHGDNCEFSYSGNPGQPAFVGSGWLELDRSVLGSGGSASESVRIEFRTSAEHGMLLWYGQPPHVYGDVADFLAIAVTDGHLHARVRLSPLRTSTLTVTSVNRVDDGISHVAVIERRGGSLQLQLDNDRLLGQSFSSDIGDTDLNVDGSVYIGGAPKLGQMSGGSFHKHFDGCILSLRLNGRPVDFVSAARDGRDVRECAAIRSRFYFNSRSRRYDMNFYN